MLSYMQLGPSVLSPNMTKGKDRKNSLWFSLADSILIILKNEKGFPIKLGFNELKEIEVHQKQHTKSFNSVISRDLQEIISYTGALATVVK